MLFISDGLADDFLMPERAPESFSTRTQFQRVHEFTNLDADDR